MNKEKKTIQTERQPLERRPRPIVFDDDHPYVVLPDGRVAKVCDSQVFGRQLYINVKLRGRKATVRRRLDHVQKALGYVQPAAISNPAKTK